MTSADMTRIGAAESDRIRSEPAHARPVFGQDQDFDVCVIGAGISGLTAAREIARRGRSVALLEAKRVGATGWGADLALASPGFAQPIESIVARVGLQQAQELWALSDEGIDCVRNVMREAGIPWLAEGRLDVFRSGREEDLSRHAAMLRDRFRADVEIWPADRIRELVRSPRYFQGAHWPRAFWLDPGAYARAVAADAERAGARIFEESPAIAIDSGGVRKIVCTRGGRIRTPQIVLAAGTSLGSLYPPLADALVCTTASIGVTEPLAERLFDAVRYLGTIADAPARLNAWPETRLYRIEGDRLLWASRTPGQSDAPTASTAERIADEIRRVFPQLGGIKIERVVSSLTSHAIHCMPLVGEAGPGLWIASGLGPHGINVAALAGSLIASSVVEGDDRWRLFCPYELVSIGPLARGAARVLTWAQRVRGRAAARLDRGRMRAGGPEPGLVPGPERQDASKASSESAAAPGQPNGRSDRVGPASRFRKPRRAPAEASAQPVERSRARTFGARPN